MQENTQIIQVQDNADIAKSKKLVCAGIAGAWIMDILADIYASSFFDVLSIVCLIIALVGIHTISKMCKSPLFRYVLFFYLCILACGLIIGSIEVYTELQRKNGSSFFYSPFIRDYIAAEQAFLLHSLWFGKVILAILLLVMAVYWCYRACYTAYALTAQRIFITAFRFYILGAILLCIIALYALIAFESRSVLNNPKGFIEFMLLINEPASILCLGGLILSICMSHIGTLCLIIGVCKTTQIHTKKEAQ